MPVNKIVKDTGSPEDIVDAIKRIGGSGSGISISSLNGVSHMDMVPKTEVDDFFNTARGSNLLFPLIYLSHTDDDYGVRTVSCKEMYSHRDLIEHTGTIWEIYNGDDLVLTVNDGMFLTDLRYIHNTITTKIRARYVSNDLLSEWSNFLSIDSRADQTTTITDTPNISTEWTISGLSVIINNTDDVVGTTSSSGSIETDIVVSYNNNILHTKTIYKKNTILPFDMFSNNIKYGISVIYKYDNTPVLFGTTTVTGKESIYWEPMGVLPDTVYKGTYGSFSPLVGSNISDNIFYVGYSIVTGSLLTKIYNNGSSHNLTPDVLKAEIFNDFLIINTDINTIVYNVTITNGNISLIFKPAMYYGTVTNSNVVEKNGTLYWFGGYVDGELRNKVGVGNMHNTYSIGYPVKDIGACVINDNTILLTGGQNEDYKYDVVQMFNPVDNTNSVLDIKLPVPVSGHDQVLLPDGRVLIYASNMGKSNIDTHGGDSILFSFDYINGDYTIYPPPPNGIIGGKLLSVEGNVYLVGGYDQNDYCNSIIYGIKV